MKVRLFVCCGNVVLDCNRENIHRSRCVAASGSSDLDFVDSGRLRDEVAY